MNIISRSRWLRCRIWRFFTIRTFLIFIFCCIILEITLGLPSYKQEDDVHTEYPRDFDSKEVTHSPFKTEKPVQELVEKKDDRKSKLETIAPFKQPLASLQSVRMRNQDEAQNSTKASYDESFYANRIIHFDLKGAAPKISYLKEVLRLIKANGATGILLEWEDTFPFSGILAENRNSDAYTVEEVRNLLETAKSLKLDVIPLVPTFGHLEWILKVEKFRQYRQNDMFPQVICLADDDGVSVVLEAIRQVVQLHQSFGITYFHIGADEAFQFGECLKDRRWLKENKNKEKDHLAAMHLAKIANYIKTLIPNVRVLAWYDMIKLFESSLIELYHLDKLLEVVVWDYSETLQQQNEFTWNSLAAKFPIVWGSSAYKGANGPLSAFLDLKHYFRNNKSWITHRKAYGTLFRTFRGLIITGWQRYDHFAVLCELLPVALPSVVLNLLVAKAGDKFSTQSIIKAATAALNCTSRISLEYMHSFDSCNFPGVELFSVIHSLRNHIKVIKSEVFESHQVKGWLNRFNIHHGYTQLWYLLQMKSIIEMHISDMLNLTKMVQSLMQPIFRKNTIDEWLYEYTDPIIEQLRELLQHISELKMQRTFAVRNFDIKRKQMHAS
uniref:beta-N-acetylhexosaminidase n=2 Tax=Wuchereria bancrofti TaxID=6293 RepID=A0AAF5PT78_WUCBA